ncbi:MAG: hypothetical protein EXX96DRAFT_578685 [Benjaminiella poitrasii]|nr:MAG: hypothetical protein EXX96DRAFT_578685 [Benjaminiella poitrasii]
MGNACSKFKGLRSNSSTIDHGFLNPQGIYTTNADYDMDIVGNLIRKGQLAPFYKGLNEPNTNYNDLCFDNECPICFLFYPSRMNRTRCCDKSICTECFLQLRRSTSSPTIPAACPFCLHPNFGVVYIPPAWSKYFNAFKKKRAELILEDEKNNIDAKNSHADNRRHWILEPNDSDVVLIDTIRPNWEQMIVDEERRTSSIGTTRRRRVQLNNVEGRNSSRRRRRSSYISGEHTIYDSLAEMDLEDVLVMEAIRLSLVNGDSSNTTTTADNNNAAVQLNHTP